MYAAQKRMQPEKNEAIECAPSAPLLDCENRRFSSLLAAWDVSKEARSEEKRLFSQGYSVIGLLLDITHGP